MRFGDRPKVLLNFIRMHEGPGRAFHGNFSHAYNLYKELLQNPAFDFTVHVDAVTLPVMREFVPEKQLYVTSVPVDSILRQQYEIVKAVRRIRPHIYHKPTGQLPLLPLPCKLVSGVADLEHLYVSLGLIRKMYRYISYQLSALYADRLICVSQATRDQVLENLPIKPEKVKVVYHGATRITDPAPIAQPALGAVLHDVRLRTSQECRRVH